MHRKDKRWCLSRRDRVEKKQGGGNKGLQKEDDEVITRIGRGVQTLFSYVKRIIFYLEGGGSAVMIERLYV